MSEKSNGFKCYIAYNYFCVFAVIIYIADIKFGSRSYMENIPEFQKAAEKKGGCSDEAKQNCSERGGS